MRNKHEPTAQYYSSYGVYEISSAQQKIKHEQEWNRRILRKCTIWNQCTSFFLPLLLLIKTLWLVQLFTDPQQLKMTIPHDCTGRQDHQKHRQYFITDNNDNKHIWCSISLIVFIIVFLWCQMRARVSVRCPRRPADLTIFIVDIHVLAHCSSFPQRFLKMKPTLLYPHRQPTVVVCCSLANI